jgi:hypothetical protein
MKLNHSSPKSRSLLAHALRVMLAGCACTFAFGALATGCLQRDVSPVTPNTTNVFVDRITVSVVDKIDLLFMIDNSISMADKQEILEEAVPQLVNRLVTPICVDGETGLPTGDNSSEDGCDSGEPEFRAVEDIHIGIVTSSLGGHGGVLCSPEHGEEYYNATQNDRGQLITRSREGSVATWNGVGFLSWDPGGTAKNPPPGALGTGDRATLIADFQNLVTGAGEQGCGFEASLEAWYRFLVDPLPPADVVRQADPDLGNQEVSIPVGVDEILLEQRKQFLRPDSLVAVIMLSDENDCSVMDTNIGWYVGNIREGIMPRSTTQCDTDPNHPCCLSCIQASWPDQCDDPKRDPKCNPAMHDQMNDRLNLRCYNQRQRFGLDFLYPTQRYVEALTSHEIEGYDGDMYENPLFAINDYYPMLVPRMDSSLIFLAGIVGVPWQDIATDETVGDPNALKFLTAGEINQRGFWDLILGDPEASPPVAPMDPFMIESVAPRSGANPRTGTAVAAPSEGAGGPAINGHEYDIQGNNDLQYACIFELRTPKECAEVQPGVGCDCKGGEGDIFMRPLCSGTTQTYAKAYPGLRFLKVLKDYGRNSIVASICPKHPVGTGTDPNFSYNPAMRAIVDRLAESLRDDCLPRPILTDQDGQPPCPLYEATPPGDWAPCGAGFPGREWAPDGITLAVLRKLRDLEMCLEPDPSCEAVSVCALPPLPPGPDREACLHDLVLEVTTSGWCYIDATTDRNADGELRCTSNCYQHADPDCDCLGNPELVRRCPPHDRRRLRFVNPPDTEAVVSWPSAQLFYSCTRQAFRTD